MTLDPTGLVLVRPDSHPVLADLFHAWSRHSRKPTNRSSASRRLTPTAPRCSKQSARAVARLDRLGELRGHVSELGVGPPHRPQAPTLTNPIELGDRLVESLPNIFRTTSTGSGLQLVRRLRATTRRRPLEPVPVRGLASLRPLTGSRRQRREPGAEASIGRGEHVAPEGHSPRGASLLESLFGSRGHPPSNRPFGSASDRVDVARRSGSAGASGSDSQGLSSLDPATPPRNRSTSARGTRNRLLGRMSGCRGRSRAPRPCRHRRSAPASPSPQRPCPGASVRGPERGARVISGARSGESCGGCSCSRQLADGNSWTQRQPPGL